MFKQSFVDRMSLAAWTDRCLCSYMLAAAIIVSANTAHTEQEPESPSVSVEQTTPAAIPLADIASESESVSTRIRDIHSDLTSERSIEKAAQQLPSITQEINGRIRENRKIMAQEPSIDMLRTLGEAWSALRRDLSVLNRDLMARTNQLDRYILQLNELGKTWQQTLAIAENSGVPQEVRGRIRAVLSNITQASEAVEKERARLLTTLNRVGTQDSRVADALREVNQARDTAFSRLFLQDSAPIWSSAMSFSTAQTVQQQSVSSFSAQWAALTAYAKREAFRFFLGPVSFIALAAALFWTRQRMRRLSTEKSGVCLTIPIFERPIAATLILSLLVSRSIYPQAPRLLWAIIGAIALIPSVSILRRLITPNLHPVLYALIVFFLTDHVRTVAAAIEFLPRVLFLTEMLGVMGFVLWLVRSPERLTPSPSGSATSHKALRFAAYVALVFSSTAFIASVLGYITLANLLGNSLVGGSYLALILYAIVVVLDGLARIVLSVRPLAALSTVSRHQSLLHHRLRRVFEGLAVAAWIIAVLQLLLLREPLVDSARRLLTAELNVGALHISLGDVLAFAITVYTAFFVSRFVRFVLDEDIYPRVRIKRGLAYAISNTLHYLILLVGFFLAVAALGFDMTRITILAGAFSVGVGFGLQNIFNNFISGLILLFERPINVGDVIQIEDASGVVERIGIRASIIRTPNGSEIIIPNGKLISERLTNWTLSSQQHGIELPIVVAEANDPKHVIEVLEKTAAGHPLITRDPSPQALVVKLDADSLGFELRAWTDQSNQWMQIRSDLAIAIRSALAAEHIAMR